jgi:hypothetical protein
MLYGFFGLQLLNGRKQCFQSRTRQKTVGSFSHDKFFCLIVFSKQVSVTSRGFATLNVCKGNDNY